MRRINNTVILQCKECEPSIGSQDMEPRLPQPLITATLREALHHYHPPRSSLHDGRFNKHMLVIPSPQNKKQTKNARQNSTAKVNRLINNLGRKQGRLPRCL